MYAFLVLSDVTNDQDVEEGHQEDAYPLEIALEDVVGGAHAIGADVLPPDDTQRLLQIAHTELPSPGLAVQVQEPRLREEELDQLAQQDAWGKAGRRKLNPVARKLNER